MSERTTSKQQWLQQSRVTSSSGSGNRKVAKTAVAAAISLRGIV
jgi:hypothetical protein